MNLRSILRILAVLAGIGMSGSALAVATVDAIPTGPKANQTVIRLFDSSGAAVAAIPGDPNRFTGLTAGTYGAQTIVDGQPVGGRQTVRLDDGDNRLRVDSTTGAVEVVRQLARRQQQQQLGWSFAVLGGIKRTPFDFTFNTAAGGANASGSLKEDAASLGFEVRHRLRNMQALGAQLFLYGTYVHYFGSDIERLILNLHPGAQDDSGARAEEKHSLMFGIGGRWNLAQRVGAELMFGAHATRVTAAAVSNENGGGGPLNVFQREKTLWGPMFAAGVTYPLATLAAGQVLLGTARWTATHLGDVSVSGTSPFTNWDYSTTVRGGWQHNFQLGIGMNF